jgi:hypothetical protein
MRHKPSPVMPQNRHSALREGLFLMIFEVFLLPIAERKLKPFWMVKCSKLVLAMRQALE